MLAYADAAGANGIGGIFAARAEQQQQQQQRAAGVSRRESDSGIGPGVWHLQARRMLTYADVC
jgi:hypothetical protein